MCALTLKIPHRPDEKNADALALILTCTSANDASINYSLCVQQRLQKFPPPPWETHVLLVFTGRRCLCLFRHRHNDVLLNHRQHSCWSGACSCSKLPIAPMGKCLAPMGFSHVLRLCLQGGGVYVQSGTVSFLSSTITGNSATYVRAQLKTSHRPDGKMAMPKSTLIFRFGLIFGSIRDMYVPATPANFPSPRWENGC